jgi:phage baseplate assembly protein V
MSAELTDLQQRLANLMRVGRVHSVDYEAARLRVSFGKDGSNVSGWVPWMTSRAGATREWNPPAVGEQVCLMNPSGQDNAGFALPGGIYQTDAPANGNEAAKVVLNLDDAGEWAVYVGNAHIKVKNGEIKIQVDGVHMTMTHTGLDIHGDVTVNGKITSTGLIKGGNVTLQTHVHSGVQSGGSNTGGPV